MFLTRAFKTPVLAASRCSPSSLRAFSTTRIAAHRFFIYAPDYTDEGALERRMKVRERHIMLLNRLANQGFVKFGGALLNDESITNPSGKKIIGSMFIIEADTAAEVRKYLEDDLYWTEGIWDKEKLVVTPFQGATPLP